VAVVMGMVQILRNSFVGDAGSLGTVSRRGG